MLWLKKKKEKYCTHFFFSLKEKKSLLKLISTLPSVIDTVHSTTQHVDSPGGLVAGVDCSEALAPGDWFGGVWSDGQ